MVQALKINNGIDAAIQTYKTFPATMKKQQQFPIIMFLKPIKKSQHETPPDEDPSEYTSLPEAFEKEAPPKEL